MDWPGEKLVLKMQKKVSNHHESFIFKILHSCGFVVTLSNSMTSACLLGMAVFFHFCSYNCKRDCASQFILIDKLEKKRLQKESKTASTTQHPQAAAKL
jgi:hypothetical protein